MKELLGRQGFRKFRQVTDFQPISAQILMSFRQNLMTDTWQKRKKVVYFPRSVRTLVPIVEGIDSTFFGKASHKEQKSLVQILAKLTEGTADE